MSVINKMLRDLDSRQGAGAIPAQALESRRGLASGTVIVNDPDRTGRRPVSRRLAVAFAASITLLGAVLAGWWYLDQHEFLQRKADQAAPVPTPAVTVPVSAVVPVVVPVVAASAVPALVAPVEAPQTAVIVAAPVVQKARVLEPAAAPADMSLKMDNTFKGLPSPATPSRTGAASTAQAVPERLPTERPRNERTVTSTTPAVAVDLPPSPQRRSPALEALAQAQSLWSAGSREAGMELLRDALAAAERENRSGTSTGSNSVLASLARELARMELAEGRVSHALEMLTRLEPALSGFADVWAIRGNAAQRLGRHEESAAAYLMALKLRPDEPRWMLGAAVSLAAQGKTANAAEWAEKARSGGVLSPEVATYLRQLGVPLRER
ncbi:tetratricopeptide repeat protein [Rhodoferax ferrireducens]|uniref:tetratricopeptide repeat protein n=1 Tax=Rhodoferax ferrireducens TaxID=192843 RepID=UPI000E0DB470|nr:hypothetical protein [Rhodoferax ferrireducens]